MRTTPEARTLEARSAKHLVFLAVAFVAVGVLIASPSTARADEFEAAEPCSVIRKCSAVGADCASTDRTCQDEAISRGLEVVCERPDAVATKRFVYCPPGGTSQDSRFVWALLGGALSIAVGGAALAFALLKKKA